MTQSQPNNPLHGITLKAMLEYLVEEYGWQRLGERINIRCFTHEPSINSSLKFLRKTAWARTKVERLYEYSIAYDERKRARDEGGADEPSTNETDTISSVWEKARRNRKSPS